MYVVKDYPIEPQIREMLINLYYDIADTLNNVHSGGVINSDYVGVGFHVAGTRCIVIDQPGCTGVKIQRPAYIALKIGERWIDIVRHEDRFYGDIHLTDEERVIGYSKIIDILIDRFA